MPYRFLPEVALADIAFEATSGSLNGLFVASAEALTEVMVDRKTLRTTLKKRLTVSSEDVERLLYDFLTELIVLKDTDSLLFKEFRVSVDEKSNSLDCSMRGETISRGRQTLRNDVKAVTMHLFAIRHEKGRYGATVVLDI